mmetsp:Transcript_62405/g.71581  ORF Transcript_62405/g.71581 Transcript_62405/m.71581 type:complete len:472 (+) Transcript_62405:106-1521(+)
MNGPRYVDNDYNLAHYRERSYIKHREMLDKISLKQDKPRIDNSKPATYRHLDFKESFLDREKKFYSRRHNQILLDKLVDVSQGKWSSVRQMVSPTNVKGPRTLNFYHKKKEAERIALENEAFARRLMDRGPVISKKKFDNEYRQQQRYRKQILKIKDGRQATDYARLPIYKRQMKGTKLPPLEETGSSYLGKKSLSQPQLLSKSARHSPRHDHSTSKVEENSHEDHHKEHHEESSTKESGLEESPKKDENSKVTKTDTVEKETTDTKQEVKIEDKSEDKKKQVETTEKKAEKTEKTVEDTTQSKEETTKTTQETTAKETEGKKSPQKEEEKTTTDPDKKIEKKATVTENIISQLDEDKTKSDESKKAEEVKQDKKVEEVKDGQKKEEVKEEKKESEVKKDGGEKKQPDTDRSGSRKASSASSKSSKSSASSKSKDSDKATDSNKTEEKKKETAPDKDIKAEATGNEQAGGP